MSQLEPACEIAHEPILFVSIHSSIHSNTKVSPIHRYVIHYRSMRMYGFDFFRYICSLQYVISSRMYIISLFTCATVFYLKIIKMCF
jgi:hypothetical protein